LHGLIVVWHFQLKFVTVSDTVRTFFNRMQLNLLLSGRFWTSLLLTLCGSIWTAQQATAQLWDVPPLPPVKYAPAQDGMTAKIGNESVHISVCRSSVIHFVAAPESPDTIRQSQPWMLDSKQSCPGAKFQISQTSDAAILTTDALKIELSLGATSNSVRLQAKVSYANGTRFRAPTNRLN
jgi:hypothetical protein